MCCERLHNYVIDADGDTDVDDRFDDATASSCGLTINDGDDDSSRSSSGITEPYGRRENILLSIQVDGITSPINNIVRNG